MSNIHTLPAQEIASDRSTQLRIFMQIPEKYHQEPVISNLISRHHLDVNILAATLGANAKGNGWFSLELRGKYWKIAEAMTYLSELDVELWHESEIDVW